MEAVLLQWENIDSHETVSQIQLDFLCCVKSLAVFKGLVHGVKSERENSKHCNIQ